MRMLIYCYSHNPNKYTMKIICEYCQKQSNSLALYAQSHCKSVAHIYNVGKYYQKYLTHGEHTCAHKIKFGECKYGVKCNMQFLNASYPYPTLSTPTRIEMNQLIGVPNKFIPISLIPTELIQQYPRKLKYYYGKNLEVMKKIHKKSRWDK